VASNDGKDKNGLSKNRKRHVAEGHNENEITFDQLKDMWEGLDDIVKYFAERQGAVLRVVRRDYRDFVGVLVKARFKLDALELYEEDTHRDYLLGKNIMEKKFVTYDANNIIQWEFIIESREVTDETK